MLYSFCFWFSQENEIKSLEAEIAFLKEGKLSLDEDLISPELAKLRTENNKLKYQMTHLQKVRCCLLSNMAYI